LMRKSHLRRTSFVTVKMKAEVYDFEGELFPKKKNPPHKHTEALKLRATGIIRNFLWVWKNI
jgi:hypothetical protein